MKPPTSSLHQLLEQPREACASRLVTTPPFVRRLGWSFVVLLPLFLLVLMLLPWQQAALGSGRVIALALEEREQTVDAPISGIIQRWHVREGEAVAAGQPLVTLSDNDPLLLERLAQTVAFGDEQLELLLDRVQSTEERLAAEQASREAKVDAARSKVDSLVQKQRGLRTSFEVERAQSERQKTLAAEGIASQRAADIAHMKTEKARASLASIQAQIEAAQHEQRRAGAEGDAKIAKAQASLEKNQASLASQQQKQLSLVSKLRRQEAQIVRAPRDGVVLRLHGGPGGSQLKKGTTLVTLIPTPTDRAVELWVDGNDMPLVREGEEVRLIFEGWPALQMVGFPGADAGTYVGEVAFIDATDDGKGNFRVVVIQKTDAHAWPAGERLRQGVRAKGWVLLGRVSLGYELWRRVNGFPSLPPVQKGNKPLLPSAKKSKAPAGLK